MSKINHEIAIFPRSEFGSGAARRMRKSGIIPAVVYGHGVANRAVSVKASEWEVLSKFELNLIYLNDNGNKSVAMVRDVQINYMKNRVVHIDFQELNMSERVHSQVHVHHSGEAYGAAHGGIFEQVVHELSIACTPADMPEALSCDVSALNIGDMIHAKDIQLPAGVELLSDPELVIFHVVEPAKEEEVAAAPADADADAAAPANAAAAPAGKNK
ncbi:MAG: 50S ribosomal protein L25 [Lentisphaeria bacterium]|nr:50S ribosomal protein L25 [Lentisphaeria bacterium]